jgi:hypothetical protein
LAVFDRQFEVAMLLSVKPIIDNYGNATSNVLGIYRWDELEIVTPEQLRLENAVLGLLTIFPNRSPERVLCNMATTTEDEVVTNIAVGELRDLLKKHPLMRLRSDIRRLEDIEEKESTLVKELQKTSCKAAKLEKGVVRGLQLQLQ